MRPRGWHVPRRKMKRISCLFLCLLPSQSLIPRTLKQELEKMKHLSQSDALSKSNSTDEMMSRIPLVLTYHPLNTRVQRILLDNFIVIADDQATSLIFLRPPMVAFRRDDNLRTSLVHTAEKQAATRAGTYPCQQLRCRTCGHISSETALLGPKDRLTIKDSFTCLSSGLIYCISCRQAGDASHLSSHHSQRSPSPHVTMGSVA